MRNFRRFIIGSRAEQAREREKEIADWSHARWCPISLLAAPSRSRVHVHPYTYNRTIKKSSTHACNNALYKRDIRRIRRRTRGGERKREREKRTSRRIGILLEPRPLPLLLFSVCRDSSLIHNCTVYRRWLKITAVSPPSSLMSALLLITRSLPSSSRTSSTPRVEKNAIPNEVRETYI